ncbi:MAG: 2Fe-2S iron-sulfur cluster-binding protein [Asticcacaulis sp.]|uniref:2Fe-2S iron-sulfur cluster-binding protein n=1 Tax=Asticcacaulis sp. TaxID=1872648 RepID=UPI0039E30868
MAQITYIEFNDKAHTVEVKNGMSVMEGAVRNNIPGIDAECGGECSCGTCQVFVDAAWFEKTGVRNDTEASILEFTDAFQPNSRLSCQIKVTDALNGLVVRMPKRQG